MYTSPLWSKSVYITSDSDLVKDIIKISGNWKRTIQEKKRTRNALYGNQKEDKTEHILECQTVETVYKIRDNTPNQWAEVVKLYRQNKELRK